jgi:hypothetical protein
MGLACLSSQTFSRESHGHSELAGPFILFKTLFISSSCAMAQQRALNAVLLLCTGAGIVYP